MITINQTHIFTLILIFTLSACKITRKAETPPVQSSPKVTAPAPKTNQTVNWENELKHSFRAYNKTAFGNHLTDFKQNYPIIIQDFLNMTLFRSNGEKVRFRMKKKVYNTLAHTSHPPLSTFWILNASDFQVNDSTSQKLRNYNALLQNCADSIDFVSHLNETQKTRCKNIFNQTRDYIRKVLLDGKANEDEFRTFALKVKPLIDESIHESALEQLSQFKAQTAAWKNEFPDENWSELRVAVQGIHMPRPKYIMTQFFQWLLKESEFEKRVVYVEYQFPIFGKNRKKAQELALNLVAKVDFDRKAAYYLLGEETILQEDITGPAAENIIKGWGTSDWFENQN